MIRTVWLLIYSCWITVGLITGAASGRAEAANRFDVDGLQTNAGDLPPEDQRLLRDIKARIGILAGEVVDFWRIKGVDWVNGGFWGFHDLNGQPVPGADKGLIQQARHLWTFSTLYALDFAGKAQEYRKLLTGLKTTSAKPMWANGIGRSGPTVRPIPPSSTILSAVCGRLPITPDVPCSSLING